MIRGIALLSVLVVVSVAAPVSAQAAPPDTLQALLNRPALKLRDLDATTWKRIRVRISRPKAKSDSAEGGLFGTLAKAFASLGDLPVTVYTQGQTITLEGKPYLVAYRPEFKAPDLAPILQQSISGGKPPTSPTPEMLNALAPTPTPDTSLALALVRIGTIQAMDGVRAFDLNEALTERNTPDAGALAQQAMQAAVLFPVFAQARQKARTTSSVSNLKQLGLGALMYLQDHDETFPPMASADAAKTALAPYVKDDSVFLSPLTKQPYKVNTSLSRKPLAAVEDPARVAMFYEAQADQNMRGILFTDGSVKFVSESEWPAILRASTLKSAAASPPSRRKRTPRRATTRHTRNQ